MHLRVRRKTMRRWNTAGSGLCLCSCLFPSPLSILLPRLQIRSVFSGSLCLPWEGDMPTATLPPASGASSKIHWNTFTPPLNAGAASDSGWSNYWRGSEGACRGDMWPLAPVVGEVTAELTVTEALCTGCPHHAGGSHQSGEPSGKDKLRLFQSEP